jgi:arylsulfatase
VGRELYNLHNDPGETRNVADAHPAVLARLDALAEKARADLGDDLTSRAPTRSRPAGSVQ